MTKISTLKEHALAPQTKNINQENQESELKNSAKPEVINALLNYSKAIRVKDTGHIGKQLLNLN